MARTYDVTTNRGKVRLLLTDTSTTSGTWDDSEIDAFLSLAHENVFMAAKIGCLDAANDLKKLMAVKLFGEVYVDPTTAKRDLIALAKEYGEMALCDAEAQTIQLQQKVDKYGRDRTDYTLTAAKTESDFADYSQDEWDSV